MSHFVALQFVLVSCSISLVDWFGGFPLKRRKTEIPMGASNYLNQPVAYSSVDMEIHGESVNFWPEPGWKGCSLHCRTCHGAKCRSGRGWPRAGGAWELGFAASNLAFTKPKIVIQHLQSNRCSTNHVHLRHQTRDWGDQKLIGSPWEWTSLGLRNVHLWCKYLHCCMSERRPVQRENPPSFGAERSWPYDKSEHQQWTPTWYGLWNPESKIGSWFSKLWQAGEVAASAAQSAARHGNGDRKPTGNNQQKTVSFNTAGTHPGMFFGSQFSPMAHIQWKFQDPKM